MYSVETHTFLILTSDQLESDQLMIKHSMISQISLLLPLGGAADRVMRCQHPVVTWRDVKHTRKAVHVSASARDGWDLRRGV